MKKFFLSLFRILPPLLAILLTFVGIIALILPISFIIILRPILWMYGISVLLYLGSKALNYCIWHRMFILYCGFGPMLFFTFFSDMIVIVLLVWLSWLLYEFYKNNYFDFSLKEFSKEFREGRDELFGRTAGGSSRNASQIQQSKAPV